MTVETEPSRERSEEQLAEEDVTAASVAVGGKAVNVDVDLGAGDVPVGMVNTAVGVGEMTVPRLGAQADSVSKVMITEEKMAFFMLYSPISSLKQNDKDAFSSPLRLDVNGYFSVRLPNKSAPLPIKPINAPRIKPMGPVAS
jgi:hypothetical protein